MNPTHCTTILMRALTSLLAAGWLLNTIPAQAASPPPAPDPHYLQSGAPLADLDLGSYSGFTLGDVDNDGDTDGLTGDLSGHLVYFRNAGGPNIGASFYRELDSRYPEGLRPNQLNYDITQSFLTYVQPELVNNDQDGDMDLFVAALDRNQIPAKLVVDYYQNETTYFRKSTGVTPDVPSITYITHWGCRLSDDYPTGYSSLPWYPDIITLAVGDLNDDGVMDGIVGIIASIPPPQGGYQYQLRIYMGVNNNQTVDKDCPKLLSTYASLPQDLRLPGSRPFPELHDADSDGDLDLFVGLSSGVVRYFENTGSQTVPSFTLRTGKNNPLNPADTTNTSLEPDFGAYVVPEFGNLTLDRRPDFAALSGDGQVFSMQYDFKEKHLAPWFTPADFLMPMDSGGRVVGIDQGAGTVTFADLDGDSDLDALTGGKDGSIRNYKNLLDETGERQFIELSGANRWFPANGGAFPYGAPLLSNFDGQEDVTGDSDLVIAAKLAACPNISTAGGSLLPAEELMLPPDVVLSSESVTPAAAGDWRLCYYENEGTPTSPVFQLNASDSVGTRYDPFSDIDSNPLPIINEYLVPAAVAADDYETYPDLVIGSKEGNIVYLHNLGDNSGPFFEMGNPADIGLDTLAVPFGSPTFLDVDGDTSPDLVMGDGDGNVRYFHNDQAPDDPPNTNDLIGPFTEINPEDNPFSFLNTGLYAFPTFGDLDMDGDLDFVAGSVLNTFRFYENVSPPGPTNPWAFVDYRVNPLGSVVPPSYASPYHRSVNFADLEGDGDLDAFVGSLSGVDYYLNIGTAQKPVFRLQPIERNPLEFIPAPNTIINVTFADTHPQSPGLEVYVGHRIGGQGRLTGYKFDEQTYKYSELETQPFQGNNFYTNYEVGTRIGFVYNPDAGCMDAYITMGSYAAAGYNSFYAVNQFLCEGLDEFGDPIYTLPSGVNDFEGNVGSAANPFFRLNWPKKHFFLNGEWNGNILTPDTWWFGNGLGEVETIVYAFYDSGNQAAYFDRISDSLDPFKGIKLPSPTIPTGADTNNDGFVDAYVGSSNGTLQYFEGSLTPPPSDSTVFLPLVKK